METIKARVVTWAKNGFDIEEGIRIFLTWNKNIFYMDNVRSKPASEAVATLKSELFFKTGITVAELDAIYEAALQERQEKTDFEEKLELDPELKEKLRREEQANADRKRREVKLRDEFSFLNDKNCPEEFEEIVQEMVTNFYRYRKKHEFLFDADPTDKYACYEAAGNVVNPYLRNRLCWDELNHYKVHGKILGEHPIFKNKIRYQELKSMSTFELTTIYNNNIKRNISYNESNLKRYPDSPKISVWNENINRYRMERTWIEQILRERGEFKD